MTLLSQSDNRIIIAFNREPATQQEHTLWNEKVEEVITRFNQELAKQNPSFKASFIHKDRTLGFFTIKLSHNISVKKALEKLHALFKKQALPVDVMQDIPVTLHDDKRDNYFFSLQSLKALEDGSLIEKRLQKLSQAKELSEKGPILAKMEQEINRLKQLHQTLYWHYKTPTVGLIFEKPAYPYIPHFFSLEELAPAQGAGVKVAIIDSGVAAFSVEGDPAYRKNENLFMKRDFTKENYNVVSYEGSDPLHNLVNIVEKYTKKEHFDEKKVELALPLWIKDYLVSNKTERIMLYLQRYGSTSLADSRGSLTGEGKQALTHILEAMSPPRFTIKNLKKPPEKDIILEFLPAEKIGNSYGHGSHVFGIVAAKPSKALPLLKGIAPKAQTIMLKAIREDQGGKSLTSHILSAFKKAIEHNVDVVNLSISYDNFEDLPFLQKKYISNLTCRTYSLVPYVVISAGNKGIATEGFPALLNCISYDVGAFNAKGDIASFSQYSSNHGPRFVAPGVDILSSTIVPQQEGNSAYGIISGTSMAAPMISGFIALMLGEFKALFTQQQLTKVCYTSTLKLKNNNDWKRKVVLGALDMRTALYVLHILKACKQDYASLNIARPFDEAFDTLLQSIHHIIRNPVEIYSQQHLDNSSFTDDFNTYYHKAHAFKDTFASTHADLILKLGSTQKLQTAITHTLDILKASTLKKPTDKLEQDVALILKQNTIDLWPRFKAIDRQRLLLSHQETYWHTITRWLKAHIRHLREKIKKVTDRVFG